MIEPSTGTLDAVEVFRAGEWNGQQFTSADLDELVRGFEAEAQGGRLPVKCGHTAPDTDPAHGWIDRIWRDGDRLLARLVQIPAETLAAIRDGRWRHVSIELLRDVRTAAGRSYRLLLDGLALLGAARPAVEGLKPLHESMTRGARFAERVAFSIPLSRQETDMTDLTDLGAENARLRAQLHRQHIDSVIEADVRGKVVLPAARETFRRMFKLDTDESYTRVSPADWQAFARTQPRPPSSAGATAHSGNSEAGLLPDEVLLARTKQFIRENEVRHFQLTGQRLDFGAAALIVAHDMARTDPTLLRAYLDQPGEV
jgi:hypothetical protein